MARSNEEEDEYKSSELPVKGGMGAAIGSGSSTGGLANSAPINSSPKAGGFNGIVDFLSSNQRGGQRMASGLMGDMETAGAGAVSNINSFVADTEKNAAAGTPKFDESVAQGWMTDTSPTKEGMERAQQLDSSTVASFNTPSPDSFYRGYEGFSNSPLYGKAQQATQNVADQAKNMGTFSGVKTLLGGKYTQAPTTQAGGSLDAALTKYGPGSQGLSSSSRTWGGISDMLGAGEKKAQGSIDTAKTQAANVSAQWQKAQESAAANAQNTNKIYGAMIQNKKNDDEAAKQDEKRRGEVAAEQGKQNDEWSRKYLEKNDAQKNERKAYLGGLVPGGLKDGWIWTQEDINAYLATGRKPSGPKQTSSGTYSTPEGYF
jgi:hypothetical protein